MNKYTPTRQDIVDAKKIYDEIIFTQVLNPAEVKRAFKLIFGYDSYNQHDAKRLVATWFQYTYKSDMIDSVETASTIGSAANTDAPQSHSESHTGNSQFGDNQQGKYDDGITDADVQQVLQPSIQERILEIESELETCVDSNEKRSLKMRLNHLKKQL